MARYRFLKPHYVNDLYYMAGDEETTVDAGGKLPRDWRPSGAVEPLDADAVRAFFAVGPQQLSVDPRAGKPKTYWRCIDPINRLFEVVGHEELGRIGL